MNRREFTTAAGGIAFAAPAAAEPAKQSIIELRYLRMRNATENQVQRTTDFLNKGALPALQRAGIEPLGFFTSVIAEESPFILALATFPNLAAMETAREKEAQDPEYRKARDAYNAGPGLGYVRLESSLLRCFESMPRPEVLPVDPKRSARIFELRMYESNNSSTLSRKIKMFNEGEAGIFKRLGMRPVFFAETIIGRNMPNLVYMLSYDSLAARDAAWKAFGEDAEWKELRSKPGYADAEIVSNISNSILRPLPFSPIR
ncbi:MAG: NIPSNAP family protein [Acidobacteriota bacterium]|nr:NIPSNAP family protein [Acidobacteriota bacterium]